LKWWQQRLKYAAIWLAPTDQLCHLADSMYECPQPSSSDEQTDSHVEGGGWLSQRHDISRTGTLRRQGQERSCSVVARYLLFCVNETGPTNYAALVARGKANTRAL
jgi:hypothetical protein